MLTVDDSDQILPAVVLGPNQLWTSKSEEEKPRGATVSMSDF